MNILNTTGLEMYLPSIHSAKDCVLTDSDGKKYIDFESGVWVLPLGHNNERVNYALTDQLSRIAHVGYRYSHPIVEEAAQALLEIMNFPKGKCVFLSSGSEAVEFAIKAVLKITNKPYLLNLDGHYISAYGLSGDTKSHWWTSIDWLANDPQKQTKYEDLLEEIPFDQIGAFVFEPGNTSGTAKLPPKELIKAITAKVKANHGFIVIDEVTTGMGRTGRWFGYEHYDITPDIIACGKGLGNGYPVSAVGMSEEMATKVEQANFLYAQSHQNDPLGCAVAKEVIAVIREENLLEQSLRQGEYLRGMLQKLSEKHPCIKEIRGIGLMCTIEFNNSYHNKLADIHKQLCKAGYLVGLKPIANVFRFYPPLTIQKRMIDDMISALDDILQ